MRSRSELLAAAAAEYDAEPMLDVPGDPVSFRRQVIERMADRLGLEDKAHEQGPFSKLAEAWWWLCENPIFESDDHLHSFADRLYIHVAEVNPQSRRIEDDPALNTQTEIWLECGPWYREAEMRADYPEPQESWQVIPGGSSSHDTDLDCGAPSFEQTIVELANLVWAKYGEYRRSGSPAGV